MQQDQLLNKINQAINIYDLVQEFNISLKRIGKNFMGLCPFHIEKTPSFSVSVEKNIAVCMSCKKGGSPFFFYKEIKKISFEQALFELSQRLKLDHNLVSKIDPNQKFYNLLQEALNCFKFNLYKDDRGKRVLRYLRTRQIEDDTINYFNLGYAFSFQEELNDSSLMHYLQQKKYSLDDLLDVGLIKYNHTTHKYYDFFRECLIFPITNFVGKIVGFVGRTLNSSNPIKYLFNQNTKFFNKSELLYQYYENQLEIRKKKQVIIYEGFFDVMVSFQCGIKNIVATMGTTLTNIQIKKLSKLTREFVFAYDGDEAGRNAVFKLSDLLHKKGLRIKSILFPDNLDPAEYYFQKGKTNYQLFLKNYVQDWLKIKSYQILEQLNVISLEEIKQKLLLLFRDQTDEIKLFYQTIFQRDYELDIKLLSSKKIITTVPKFFTDNYYFSISHFLLKVINDRFYLYDNWDKFVLKSQILNNPNFSDKQLFKKFFDFIIEIKKYYDLNINENFIVPDKFSDFLKTNKGYDFLVQYQDYIKDINYYYHYYCLQQEISQLKLKLQQEKDVTKQKQILEEITKLQLKKAKKQVDRNVFKIFN